uniref:Uncharacterized protein n=1 Tax=Tanacetum cinerariifolium TaxID=118510 RepID=A0A699JXS2_TANCI|nr:hypothetical protein [Tanacetum cinerariifolium]
MDIKIPQSNVPSSAADEAITKEMHDGLRRAIITVSSLKAEQGSGSLRTSSKGGPECYFTMGDSPVQARPERLSNLPNEQPLEEGNKSRSGKDNIQLLELMAIYTKLSDKVTHLENELTTLKLSASKDKGKAIMQEFESLNKIKKKKMMQISLNEEIAQRFYKEEQAHILRDKEYAQQVQTQWITNEARLAQENLAQAEQWDDVQAQIQADENLAQRMLEEERDSLSIEERFVPMESEGQATNSKAGEGSSKAGKSLKRSAKEELGHEQKVEEEITQQEDVVAKQAKKESSKKAGGRLKIKTSKARENKDKRQKKHDDPENLHL